VYSFHTCVVSSHPPAPPPPPAPPIPIAVEAPPEIPTSSKSNATAGDDTNIDFHPEAESEKLYHPALMALREPSTAPLHEFYIYRAMSDTSFAPENVNAANAEGVMWYLHNEVVIFTPRKFSISRIVRFKVQYRAPQPLHDKGMDFGVRYAFDSGKCTGPGNCNADFSKYGYFVGCNKVYQYPTYQFADAKYYDTDEGSPTWYSLPGPCNGHDFRHHTAKCVNQNPGGACAGTPTGKGDCTYTYEPAGEVRVDDIVGISDYVAFARTGGREYIPGLGSNHCRSRYWCDKGIHTTFWNWKHSKKYNKMRVDRLKATFKEKYPDDKELPDVPCDFKQWQFYH